MSSVVDTIVEMGFPKERVLKAVKNTQSDDAEVVLGWLLSHSDEPMDADGEDALQREEQGSADGTDGIGDPAASIDGPANGTAETPNEETKQKAPLTEEEKQEQLLRLEELRKQKRAERIEREKAEALEKEKMRIKQGKDILEIKRRHEEMEMKKLVEEKRREKIEARLAKERVKQQIEQDRQARREKYGDAGAAKPDTAASVTERVPAVASSQSAKTYDSARIQVRLLDGSCLTQSFKPAEPLAAVRTFIDVNRPDSGSYTFMTNFPRKVFSEEDMEAPLSALGLVPSAVLIMKSNAGIATAR